MSVVIKDMDMPKCCAECSFLGESIDSATACRAYSYYRDVDCNYSADRPEWCPMANVILVRSEFFGNEWVELHE